MSSLGVQHSSQTHDTRVLIAVVIGTLVIASLYFFQYTSSTPLKTADPTTIQPATSERTAEYLANFSDVPSRTNIIETAETLSKDSLNISQINRVRAASTLENF